MLNVQDIFRMNVKELYFDNKISDSIECLNEITNALIDDNCRNIIAPTGAGKNYAICNAAIRLGINIVLLSPYTMNVKQTASEYSFATPMSIKNDTLSGADPNSNIHIVSTYDSLNTLVKNGIDLSRYILIIDEFHNFVVQSAFRSRAIIDVNNLQKNFRKVITITGTPEGVIHNNYETIKLIPRSPGEKTKINIIAYKGKLLDAVLAHVQVSQHKGKVVIFRNDKSDLEYLYEVFRKCHRNVQLLSSDEKDGDNYLSIAKNQEIKKNVEILLTTSVISDGVNIKNEDIAAVYFLEVEDMIMYRQFFRRFRKGVSNVFDFVKSNNRIEAEWPDFPTIVGAAINKYEILCENLSSLFKGLNMTISESMSVFAKEYVYFDKMLNKLCINKNRIILDELSKIFKLMRDDLGKRKEYLEAFENVLVTINSFDLNKVGTEEIKEDLTVKKEIRKEKMLNALNQYPNESIHFLANCGIFIEYDNFQIPRIDIFVVEELLNTYRSEVNTKDFANLCKSYYELKLRGVEHNQSIRILEMGKKTVKQVLRKLDILTVLNPEQSVASKSSLTLIEKRIVLFWSKQLNAGDTITIAQLFAMTEKRLLQRQSLTSKDIKLTKKTAWNLFTDLFDTKPIIRKEYSGNKRKSRRDGYIIVSRWTFETIIHSIKPGTANGNLASSENNARRESPYMYNCAA